MEKSQNALLEVKGLDVSLISEKNRVKVVDDLSFSVSRGETLGIVGESGCGKSMTAVSIMRLLPPKISGITGGGVYLDGQDLTLLSERQMRNIRGKRISMIFQDPLTALNPVYNIGDQLTEMIMAHTSIGKKKALELGVEMLEKVGIPAAGQRIKQYPHQMSGGMRQRVMIAMALSCKPEILIADEPTTALDVTIQAQILELIDHLKRQSGMAVLLITHDMGVIAEVADNVMVMYAGEMVEYGPVSALLSNPLHPYTQGLLKSIPRLDRDQETLYTIDGMVADFRSLPRGCRFHSRCPICLQKCATEKPAVVCQEDGRQVRCWKYARQN